MMIPLSYSMNHAYTAAVPVWKRMWVGLVKGIRFDKQRG